MSIILMILLACINLPFWPNTVNVLAFGFCMGLAAATLLNKVIER
jgi:hypothetical protein